MGISLFTLCYSGKKLKDFKKNSNFSDHFINLYPFTGTGIIVIIK